MSIDFRKKLEEALGPEKWAAHLLEQERTTQAKADAKELDDKDLADSLEYTIVNSFELLAKHGRSVVTYEDALINIYLPEILRRLRGQEDISTEYNTYSELRKRIEKMGE